jgi:hypothetical protein
VAKEDHCEDCGEPGELLYHVAFRCNYAISFWHSAMELTGCKVPNLHPGARTQGLLKGEN